MKEALGVIDLFETEKSLRELTRFRATAAVPFGGSYRIIDFIMSSMLHSGVENVAVTAYRGYRSVLNHLGTANEWGLNTKAGGLFILPPADFCPQEAMGNLLLFGDNLDYFLRSEQEYVLICADNVVSTLDYQAALDFHRAHDADITILYSKKQRLIDKTILRVLRLTSDGVVLGVEPAPAAADEALNVSMGMYLIKKSLLLDMIQSCVSRQKYDFLRDGVIANLKSLKVLGYSYPGHVAFINSVASYYRHSLELLDPELYAQIFPPYAPIYTRRSNSPPTRYEDGAQVQNACISNGCRIAGTVLDSVLFRRVKVHKRARVTGSIIMQDTIIEEGAVLENAIVDKGVRVTSGTVIRGTQGEPAIIGKKQVV